MLTHGGDIVGFEQEYGENPLDFSVNTNPLGLSPMAEKAMRASTGRVSEYPDPLYRKLRQAIAEYENVPKDWVLCGNGAAELIWRLAFALRPESAVVTAPTFSEYEAALMSSGCRVKRHLLLEKEGFALTDSILPEIMQETDILFLCSPNNPTGFTIHPELLREILEHCEKTNTLLVMDECFGGFLPDEEKHSLKAYLGKVPKLFVLKAFTKLYGMAGLRLGYGLCSDTGLLEKLRLCGQSWPVSVVAEETGIAALRDKAYLERTRAFIPTERERVRRAMELLDFYVYPGEANYLLFRTGIPELDKKLAQKGILIRNCSNYVGLGQGYYRIAIRRREDNDRLLRELSLIRRKVI